MPIRAKYVHTNLIARDWKRLVQFYSDLFGCIPKGSERDMSGAWLDQVTSLRNAHLRGVHLSLPGYGDDVPTLEIFSYRQLVEGKMPNCKPVRVCPYRVCGRRCEPGVASADRSRWRRGGEIATTQVDSVGVLRVVYARDSEGNIIELQKWN